MPLLSSFKKPLNRLYGISSTAVNPNLNNISTPSSCHMVMRNAILILRSRISLFRGSK